MAKLTRKEKKEEEKRIIQELESAMSESEELLTAEKKSRKNYGENMPEKLHCKRCRTLMEEGVCPLCGYRVYMPMADGKRKMWRWIVTGVCLVGCLLILLLTR